MPAGGHARELYAEALRRGVQIRRFEPRHDDLEAIFLKALEADQKPSQPSHEL